MLTSDIINFGEFIIYCAEADIPKEKAIELMFILLDDKTITTKELIKEKLNEHLSIDAYISMVNKLNLK